MKKLVFVFSIFFLTTYFLILTTHSFVSAQTALQITNVVDNRADYPASEIPKYEKLEITFQVQGSQASNFQYPYLASAEANQYTQKFIDTGISVDAFFLAPGELNWQNAYRQPAFYHQEFQDEIRNNQPWFYPTSNYSWKVRFSPGQEGVWRYKLTAIDMGGQSESSEFAFTVSTSSNKGFIRVSPTDPRYFEYDNGDYFPGLGYNLAMNQLYDDTALQKLQENKIQLIRAWLSPFNIYGSAWSGWGRLPGYYGGYLPRVPVLPLEVTPGQPMEFKWYLSQTSSWYEQCAFLGHTQPDPTVKPNTTYHIRAKYKGTNITGPRDTAYQNFGFVIKIGGWQHNPGT